MTHLMSCPSFAEFPGLAHPLSGDFLQGFLWLFNTKGSHHSHLVHVINGRNGKFSLSECIFSDKNINLNFFFDFEIHVKSFNNH